MSQTQGGDDDEVARRLADNDARIKAVDHDLRMQFHAVMRRLHSIDRISDDRHETLLARFDRTDALLEGIAKDVSRIAKQLGTNGSGGKHHG